MKNTPSPWFQRNQGNEIEIKSGIYTIAMVHNFNEPHETNVSNAKLITAAPELLQTVINSRDKIASVIDFFKYWGTKPSADALAGLMDSIEGQLIENTSTINNAI